MEVEISDDDGLSWTLLEVVGPTGEDVDGDWFLKTFRIDEYVQPTNLVRVRFSVNDPTTDSIVEEAIDRVSVEVVVCFDDVPGDLNGDGLVNGADLSIVLGLWGECADACDCIADLDKSGFVDGADLAMLLGAWNTAKYDLDGDGIVTGSDLAVILGNWFSG